jgi:hypothetical protein
MFCGKGSWKYSSSTSLTLRQFKRRTEKNLEHGIEGQIPF